MTHLLENTRNLLREKIRIAQNDFKATEYTVSKNKDRLKEITDYLKDSEARLIKIGGEINILKQELEILERL